MFILSLRLVVFYFCFFNAPATTEIYTYVHTLSLHDALPISRLDRELAASGFLSVALEPDYGPLCAALVTEEIAKLPLAVEAMATALPTPMAFGRLVEGPISIVDDAARTARFQIGRAHV